jgi:hypothetical protein
MSDCNCGFGSGFDFEWECSFSVSLETDVFLCFMDMDMDVLYDISAFRVFIPPFGLSMLFLHTYLLPTQEHHFTVYVVMK